MTKFEAKPHFDLQMVRGFLDPQTCSRFVAELNCSPGSPALSYGKSATEGLVDERMRKVERLQPSAQTAGYVARRLAENLKPVAEHFGVDLRSSEEPQFLRYDVGDFFVAHQDGNTGLVKLETEARRVSVSIFLNNWSEQFEPDAYGGGLLVFSDWHADSRLAVEGEAGTLLAFRSEITHEVTPVTFGQRYSIVSWYR